MEHPAFDALLIMLQKHVHVDYQLIRDLTYWQQDWFEIYQTEHIIPEHHISAAKDRHRLIEFSEETSKHKVGRVAAEQQAIIEVERKVPSWLRPDQYLDPKNWDRLTRASLIVLRKERR